MNTLRKVFLADWRNKLIALFFAVSIWFVSYQSEKKGYATTLRVEILPQDSAESVIVGMTVAKEGAKSSDFSGNVEVEFSGSRKEIDLLEDRLKRSQRLRVPATTLRHVFQQEEFGYPRDGVEIVSFDPPAVVVAQEKVEEVLVQDLRDKILLLPFPKSKKVLRSILKPESQSVRLRIPASLKGKFSVQIPVTIQFGEEEIDRLNILEIHSQQSELVARAVQIWDESLRRWASVKNAPKVHVRVILKDADEVFENPAVKLTFRVPLTTHPYLVVLDDVQDGTIPVKFIGPKKEIDRLRKKFEDQPSFSLGIPVATFDGENGVTSTFSEGDLEIPGFSDIRLEQHESRKRESKTAWSYEIKVFPVKGAEGSGGE